MKIYLFFLFSKFWIMDQLQFNLILLELENFYIQIWIFAYILTANTGKSNWTALVTKANTELWTHLICSSQVTKYICWIVL